MSVIGEEQNSQYTAKISVWASGPGIQGHGLQTKVSALDHGFTVGDGVFETIKVTHGQPFALTRHLERLENSARGMGLELPDRDAIQQGLEAVLAERKEPLARLRLTWTSGQGPLGSERLPGAGTLVVACAAANPWPKQVSAVAVPWVRNERSPVTGLKTTSYGENVIALAYANARGGSEALFADTQGRLSEGTGANVFVVLNGNLLTPSLDCGALPGITRALLLEWAAEEGLPCTETHLPMTVLAEAEQVILTSSTRDVQLLAAVDGRPLQTAGGVGERAAQLFTRRALEHVDP